MRLAAGWTGLPATAGGALSSVEQKAPLRVLIVEDNESEALLLLRELDRGGYAVAHSRVHDASALAEQLRHFEWDVVIADHDLPAVSALEALALLRASGRDLPFIVLSGAAEEARAGDVLRDGADDLVVKGRWARLVPAVRRALGAAGDRRARRDLAARLRESEERLRLVVASTPIVLMSIGADERITLLEGEGLGALGLRSRALVGRTVSEEWPDVPEVARHVRRALGGATLRTRLELRQTLFDAYFAPLREPDGDAVRGITVVLIDATERQRIEQRLEHLALYDSLTDLPNRVLLADRLDQALREAERDGEPLALLIMDLDRFKDINETLGHHVGDLLLREVGPRLRERLRGIDTLARLGGDEFALLLPNTGQAGALSVATEITRRMQDPFTIEGHRLYVAAAIGIALYPGHGSDAETLRRRADIAMYTAKRAANGGHAFYVPSDGEDATLEQLQLVDELRHAIETDEIVLHYQPKVDLATSEVRAVEGLVRWQHPREGLIPPDRFLGTAERSGLIRPLTASVLRQGLAQVRRWNEQGLHLGLAVNLSMRTLLEPSTPALFSELLAQSGVSAAQLTVEITESAMMSDPARVLENVRALHDMGLHISVDDYGTVYASLTYLRQFPVAQVKVDKSFVMHMAANEKDRHIVRSVIYLARGLGIQAVAEGVEDEHAWRLLRNDLGCDVAQGYFFARPMPAEDIPDAVREIPLRLRRLDQGRGLPRAA